MPGRKAPAKKTSGAKGRASSSTLKRRAPAKRGSTARARSLDAAPSRIGAALRALFLRLFLVVLVVGTGYGVWLDFKVRARFEGATWALPARIYARPLELYPGQALKPSVLNAELAAAGYHRVRHVDRAGSFARAGGRFEIATREFQFWDGREPSRRLSVDISGGQVTKLTEGGRDAALARLDPALIGRIHPGHAEDRELVQLANVPKALIGGLLAVEDRAFYEHHGVSFRGIARAAWANLRAGGAVQGGSTLTQQLAKNLFLSSERRLERKLNEAAMALILEARYPKDVLLEAYVNEVYLGQDGGRAIHGFGLASWFYFGRRLDELKVHESALLVGMVKGASAYNPRRHPDRARKRRDLVLDVMAEQGVISPEVARRAMKQPLGLSKRAPGGSSPHPHFIDLVRSQLTRDYRSADLKTEGLQIFTTMEPPAQARAERALTTRLQTLERKKRGVDKLQGAVVLVRPASGEVVAVVGDRNPKGRGFNRALNAERPIGSLVKPAVYLRALARGPHHLMSPLIDAPLTIRTRGQPSWSPQNYNKDFEGEVLLMSALAQSNNLATVRLGLELGLPKVANTLRSLGVDKSIPEVPSLLLGSLDLSPFEVAQVYQPLANGGYRSPLRAIREVTDAKGRALSRYGLQVTRAADPGAVYLVRHAMERVMSEGTARSVGQKLPLQLGFAGKTGTTDDLRDSWFAGFNDELLGVIWIGRDDNRPAKLTGASGALRVWGDIVPPLVDSRRYDASPPEGVSWHWVTQGGRSVTDAECPGSQPLPFRAGAVPEHEPCASLSVAPVVPVRTSPTRTIEIPLQDDAG